MARIGFWKRVRMARVGVCLASSIAACSPADEAAGPAGSSSGEASNGAGSGASIGAPANGGGANGGATSGGDAGQPSPAGADAASVDGGAADATLGNPILDMVATFTASQAEFPASDRGFYVTPNDSEMNVATLTQFAQDWGNRLFLYVIDLSPYTGGALPQSFLTAIDQRFGALRGAGAKSVLMARYSDTSSCDDAPLSIVKQHLAQLKPVFAANVDVIAYFRAGIIGAWGEGWCSNNGLHDEPGHSAVRDALLDAAPPNLHVAFQPVDMQAWQSIPRVASKNDCFMATDDDAYNFPGGLNTPLRAFAMARNDTTPYGGETCENSAAGNSQARTSCADILREGRDYHVAHLNQGYAPLFVNRWKADGCFEEVRRSIGYRFELVKIAHPSSSVGGATFAVDVHNAGWARIFSKRPLVVTLKNKATGALITGAGGDLNAVASGATVTIKVNVSAGPGDYDVMLSAPDIYATTAVDPRFSVRFANANAGAQSWDDATARMSTGTTLKIQ